MNAISQLLWPVLAQQPATLLALGSTIFRFAPVGLAALGFFATLFFSGFDEQDEDDD